MHHLAKLDQLYVWHPFTQMRDWLKQEPIVIAEGRGAVLRDIHGHEYLDGNSSIWTNLHGHRQSKITAAIIRQLGKIAHSSALGLANEPASLLAEKLVQAVNGIGESRSQTRKASNPAVRTTAGTQTPALNKVFFSDDGSTAMEVALKLSAEFARRQRGIKRPKFLSLEGAYHGDTIGAVSLGHIDLFHKAYEKLLFKTEVVPAPYCYRCPFNKAKPERVDARQSRKCQWECVQAVEEKFTKHRKTEQPITAIVVEPLIQGAAGMIPQPDGWLKQVDEIVRENQAQLIADEILTGFGRAVSLRVPTPGAVPLFACQTQEVRPDFMALAKGLTGGFLPMAATLTTQSVFDAFLGDYSEFKTFFHGHSYTGNQLGAAAALANLEILRTPQSVAARRRLENGLRQAAACLWQFPNIGDVRQVGLILAVELVRDWRTRKPFALRERAGMRVCEAMARHGVLTRPIGNVVVLMPPYCTTPTQLQRMIEALTAAVEEVAA